MDNDKKCFCWSKVWRFGVFIAVIYALCFLWLWFGPDKGLHLQLFQNSFLWFSGVNFWSFVAGLVQSFIWGIVVFVLFKLIVGCCYCKDEKCDK